MTRNTSLPSYGQFRLPEPTAERSTELHGPRRRLHKPDSKGPNHEEELVVAYTWPQESGWQGY